MIEINGAEGEGGGQVLRTACALSLITGEPFHITQIRGKRAKPGLLRQHLTAVEAARTIGAAQCEGLAMRSSELTFRPGPISAGDYHFSIGTAGSTGLVLQTVLMPLLLADGPSRLVLEGGTHNLSAPPFEFIDRCFLPIVNRMGPRVEARLVRHGFYPGGGGRIEVDITPAPLSPIDCLDRGVLTAVSGTALWTGLPPDVVEREILAAREVLGWPEEAFVERRLSDAGGPGTALLLEATFEQGREIVTGFGQIGVPAQLLAKTAAERMGRFLGSRAFAGPHLQDQLLLPFALAGGGSFTTVKPSQHTRTAAMIISLFTGRRWSFEQESNGATLARVH
ncbi:MAG: RNA 3'-terminal phosphate cyclase [Rhodospirillum sp.]|nr:RNA 3'-terminal phosphate cyclase [Rhodospirillum sp.]